MMSYLRLRNSQIILGAFLLFALFAIFVPSVDLYVAKLFYNGVAFPKDAWWVKLEQDFLDYFLRVSMSAIVLVFAWNLLFRQRVLKIDGRKVAYLLCVLIVGAGLIVNVGFKSYFGRARPRDVAEFGGTKHFTPAFVVSGQCTTNCSFSSGDAAGGFFAISLVMVLQRRRRFFAAAAAFGSIISIARLAAGAHFLSDTITSFFVMLLVSDVLYHYMIAVPAAREVLPALEPELAPARVTLPADATD